MCRATEAPPGLKTRVNPSNTSPDRWSSLSLPRSRGRCSLDLFTLLLKINNCYTIEQSAESSIALKCVVSLNCQQYEIIQIQGCNFIFCLISLTEKGNYGFGGRQLQQILNKCLLRVCLKLSELIAQAFPVFQFAVNVFN